MSKGKLVIVRHAESEWNATGRWTGWTNVHITEKGKGESRKMGEQLKDIKFDLGYVSEQVRSEETLQELLKTQGQADLKYEINGAINERNYGDYTGMNKWEVKQKVGEAEFNNIRRGWEANIPNGENLHDVYNRAIPFYKETVAPQVVAGKNIIICAHGNSIRALIKYIESISDQDIANVEMIFGTILIYDIDDEGKMLNKEVRKTEVELPPA